MSVPPPIPNPPEPRGKTRPLFLRVLLWLGKAIGVLVIFIILLTTVLAIWPDGPDVDDSDMIPVWTENVEDNPLTQFERWAEVNPELLPAKGDARLKIVKKNAEWDGAAADGLLEEYKEAIDQFKILITSSDESWQWKGGAELASLTVEPPSIYPTLYLGNLIQIQCLRQIEHGHYDEALDSAENLLLFGNKLAQSEGNLIHYIVSRSMGKAGQACLERLGELPGTSLSEQQYRKALRLLENYEPATPYLAFALKCEYLSFKRLIDDCKAGNTPVLKTPVASPFLQRNDTLALYREIIKPLIVELDSGNFPSQSAFDKSLEKVFGIRRNLVKLFVHPNAAGKMIVVMGIPAGGGIAKGLIRDTVKIRTTIILLALQKYQAEKGQLPESLALLVPEYLAEIPNDLFSDKPLIWNFGKKTIYSVGHDRVDDGGMIHLKSYRKGSDIGLQLKDYPVEE